MTSVDSPHPFEVGALYKDCNFHPCLCVLIDEEERVLEDISLIDGTSPRSCDIDFCGPEPLTTAEAMLIKSNLAAYVRLRQANLDVRAATTQLAAD